jgi:hypothetical protein
MKLGATARGTKKDEVQVSILFDPAGAWRASPSFLTKAIPRR